MKDKHAILLHAALELEPMLVLADGRVWEGHVRSCAAGSVRAVMRPVGSGEPLVEKSWSVFEIDDVGRQEYQQDGDEEPEDELLVQARAMVAQAREVGELSLAERLVRDRLRRQDVSSS